jgi:hypothetical protein
MNYNFFKKKNLTSGLYMTIPSEMSKLQNICSSHWIAQDNHHFRQLHYIWATITIAIASIRVVQASFQPLQQNTAEQQQSSPRSCSSCRSRASAGVTSPSEPYIDNSIIVTLDKQLHRLHLPFWSYTHCSCTVAQNISHTFFCCFLCAKSLHRRECNSSRRYSVGHLPSAF